MEVITMASSQWQNSPRGAFALTPSAKSIPGQAIDYALCQICRLSKKDGGIVSNPADELGWNPSTTGEDAIKLATLNPDNGWFVDNLFRAEAEKQNCIYFMDSFDPASIKTILDYTADCVDSGTRYISGGPAAGSPFSGATIAGNLRNGTIVATGSGAGKQVFLQDRPDIAADDHLDFRVYLMYRTGTEQKSEFVTVGGFTWSFDGADKTATFGGFFTRWADLIEDLMGKAMQFQNQTQKTQWSYRQTTGQ